MKDPQLLKYYHAFSKLKEEFEKIQEAHINHLQNQCSECLEVSLQEHHYPLQHFMCRGDWKWVTIYRQEVE